MLEDKQIASERIVVEQNILEQEKIKKEQVIIQAEAEAKQIEIKSEALKQYPEIIQLEFIQKLSPNITWGILPGEGIVPFLDLLKLQEDFESTVPATGNVQNTENLDQNTSEENNTAE
ncbi:MAG: hypothetical protein L6405_08820 [Actinomycetia bacterium]|nr:hypothetical protein [Actinomycetes bacterium]